MKVLETAKTRSIKPFEEYSNMWGEKTYSRNRQRYSQTTKNLKEKGRRDPDENLDVVSVRIRNESFQLALKIGVKSLFDVASKMLALRISIIFGRTLCSARHHCKRSVFVCVVYP